MTSTGETAMWDFETALGDTIRDRYQGLYVRIIEVSNRIHRKTIQLTDKLKYEPKEGF